MQLFYLLTVVGSTLATAIILQYIWWYFSFGSDFKADYGAQIVLSPLRLLYSMRALLGGTLLTNYSCQDTDRKIRKAHQEVWVRYGELTSSRGKDVGTLALGLANSKEIMHINRKRVYN